MFHNQEQKSHKNWFHVDDIKSRCDKQDGVNTGVFRRSHPRNCKAHYGVCLPCSNELAWFTKTEPRPSHWDGSAHSCLGNKINYYQMRNWAIRSVSLESGTCLPPHNLQEMRRASAGTTKTTPRHRAQLKPRVAWAAIMYEIKLPSLTCQVGWRRHYPLVLSPPSPRKMNDKPKEVQHADIPVEF